MDGEVILKIALAMHEAHCLAMSLHPDEDKGYHKGLADGLARALTIVADAAGADDVLGYSAQWDGSFRKEEE